MVTKKNILDAYLFLRKENHDIPSEALDFMLESSMESLESTTVWNKPLMFGQDCKNKDCVSNQFGVCKYRGLNFGYCERLI